MERLIFQQCISMPSPSEVDQSAVVESVGKQQSNFLNWLQDKLEAEMKKPSYKDYYKNEHKTKKQKSRKRHTI